MHPLLSTLLCETLCFGISSGVLSVCILLDVVWCAMLFRFIRSAHADFDADADCGENFKINFDLQVLRGPRLL